MGWNGTRADGWVLQWVVFVCNAVFSALYHSLHFRTFGLLDTLTMVLGAWLSLLFLLAERLPAPPLGLLHLATVAMLYSLATFTLDYNLLPFHFGAPIAVRARPPPPHQPLDPANPLFLRSWRP